MMSLPTAREVARTYLRREWMPIPIPHQSKNPGFKGWQNFKITEAELPSYFNGQVQNVGVLLGSPSGGLIDIDLDCDEAVSLAPRFIPTTGAIFGRESRPRSHQLFYSELKTRKFSDPLLERHKDERERGKAMLIEIRSTGAQTIFPGSVHPSGEAVFWESDCDPARIDPVTLESRVGRVAAAALLARYWPYGRRNDAANALAGGLLRAGWTVDEVGFFIEAVCLAAKDEETAARVKNAIATAAKLTSSEKATGWPTLAQLMDESVVSRVCEWLKVRSNLRAAAQSGAWNTPEELPDDLRPVPSFDTYLLPEALRAWIADISERMQCPVDFPAVAALTAAASLIGNRLPIRPKRADGWTVVPNLWGAIVGKPGVLKSPSMEDALKPLKARERLAREEFQTAMDGFEFQRLCADAQRELLKKDIQKAVKEGRDGSEYRERLAAMQTDTPVERRYIVNDPTVEKLGELLNLNPRGLLLFRDELVGWFKSLDREGREQDRTFYLETWTGSGSYVYDRIGRGTLRIDNLTVSILGSIQPGPLTHYLRGALGGGYGDDGLMQRFQLSVYPDVLKGWRYVDRAPDAEAARRAHECFARLDTLSLEESGAQVATEDGAIISFLRFAADAQEFFDSWYADLETELHGDSFEHPALEAHMSKYRSLMPSLALIFHLMDRVSGATAAAGVTLDAARRSAAWCTLLEAHARRIYGLALSAEVRQAKLILSRIRRGDLTAEFTARDIYRKQWAGLTKPSDVTEPLRILEDHGWLRSFAIGKGESGGRVSTCYLAHPMLTEARGALRSEEKVA